MAAYRRVYDSHHLQADCQKPGSAPEPYAMSSSMGYLFLFAVNKPLGRDDGERIILSRCRRIRLAGVGKRRTSSLRAVR